MRKLAVALLVVVALGSSQSALRYLFATEFMPYHAVIIGKSWAQIDPSTQFMLLTMMKAMGAGTLAVAMAILCFAYRAAIGERWAGWAALFVGSCIWVPVLYLTMAAKAAKPQAQPPSEVVLGSLLLLLAAAILLWLAKEKPKADQAKPVLDAGAG
jgi:hypothetical protein